MIFWHAELVRWVVCWQQGVEKTVEFACTYETDVADLHWPIWVPWVRLPQCMSERRILDCELFAKDVVVGHLKPQESKKNSMPVRVGALGGAVEDVKEDVTQHTGVSNDSKHGPTCEALPAPAKAPARAGMDLQELAVKSTQITVKSKPFMVARVSPQFPRVRDAA
jgi:hypothetical protein